MKNFFILLSLGFITLSTTAQKIIEKNMEYTHQSIVIDLKFASDIKIKTWDKPSMYVKSQTTMVEKKYESLFEIKTNSDSHTISIADNAESIFKKMWEDHRKEHGQQKEYFSTGDSYEINYILYLPKNAQFKISSINGNLSAERIEGEFTADFINGNITIANYAGTMNLSTINGEIDLKMVNTTLCAETIHGNIYADENLKFTTEDRIVGQKLEGQVEAGKHRLKLNTINGNMYLRLP